MILKYFDGDSWCWIGGISKLRSTYLSAEGCAEVKKNLAEIMHILAPEGEDVDGGGILVRFTKTGDEYRDESFLFHPEFQDRIFLLNDRGETIDRP